MHDGLLLAQLAILIAVAQAGGYLLHLLRQPRVIGEMTAGIALGPTVLGLIAPSAYSALFAPAATSGLLSINSFVEVIFIFLIGLRVDVGELRRNGRAALLISGTSTVLPFLLGVILSLYLYRHASYGNPVTLALFMGTAMSVTAFPVLARIIHERGIEGTRLGSMALSCAAFSDLAAWVLLAVVVSLSSGMEYRIPPAAMALSVLGAGVVLLLIRFGVEKALAQRPESVNSLSWVSLFVVLALLSGSLGDFLGVHSMVLAFLAGVCTPRRLAARIVPAIWPIALAILLPLFFAVTGLRTDLWAAIRGAGMTDFLLVLLTALLGKWGGAMAGGVAAGMGWKEACQLGILLNTRGLVELVVLNVGRDLQVISNDVFSMMVCMAILTTAMTTPLSAWMERFPRTTAVTKPDSELTITKRTGV
jgi:Kef-type K+ transport system membrane component KefB